MAPRPNTRAGAACSTAVRLLDLPADCQTRIMRFLGFQERRRLALVCKQFASLVNDPMLATDVCPVRSVSLAELEAFAGWMAAHGGHMRRLQLDTTALWAGVLIAVGDPDLRTNLTGMGRCLMPAFATAAGSLQQLQLTSRVLATALLGDLPVLRSVELNAGSMMGNGVLSVGLNFAGLTAVESLQLRCRNIDFMRGAQLPPNLTRLRLSRDTATQLPAQVQVTRLPRLAQLELSNCYYSADSLAVLPSLDGSLTRLDIHSDQQMGTPAAPVPPTLAALTGLRHLSLRGFSLQPEAAQQLDAALPELGRLTCLVLTGEGLALPPAVGSLGQLQRCLVVRSDAPAAPPPLPLGPWLSRLRWLGANWGSLLRSNELLSAARALEFVAVHATGDDETKWNDDKPGTFFDWAAQHPPLRRLTFEEVDITEDFDSHRFAMHLLSLWQQRPGLKVWALGFGNDGRPEMFLNQLDSE